MSHITRLFFIVSLSLGLSGCVGTMIDAAVDTTLAVAKIPFKVADAAIDVVAGDGDDEKDNDK